jgi:hypothetical protein
LNIRTISIDHTVLFFAVENWDRTKDELIPKSVQSDNQPTKKSKKKSNLRQAIAQSKPTFDPSK